MNYGFRGDAILLENSDRSLFLPTHYDRFVLFAPLREQFYCHARRRSDSSANAAVHSFDLTFLTPDGNVLGRFHPRIEPNNPRLLGAVERALAA